ncbi:MAG: Na+/H+ antiporter NhaC family protein [Clostridia bacterium]|nr:Na+/H+ antiporter NhaC family protein [Clostridia bacterium]
MTKFMDITPFYGTFWALFPPIVAIILALLTKEVYSSLFIGILTGALMYSNFNVVGMIEHTITIISSRLGENGGIIVFLICLGIIVSLMQASGCSKAFGNWAATVIKTKRTSLIFTSLLGLFFCIDDYFNSLTTANIMRPITDKHKVSRARLAYNVDCTAAPICIIAPISSWAAAVASYIPPEVDADGYALFLRAIPFNMYAILTLTMLFTLAMLKFDFGPMRGYEYLAEEKGDIYGGTGDVYANISTSENDNPRGKAPDMILPVVVLILGCVFGLLYTGDFFAGKGVGFIEAFSACDAYMGLPIGGLIALVFTVVYYFLRRIINMKQFIQSIPDGAVAMTPALFILTLSWGIEGICRESLGAAVFVENTFANSSFPLWLLPPILYLLGAFVSFATGTSWGTFGILIPITFAIFGYQVNDLCIICLSATLAGAVTGDHCSPISETAIMSSTAAQVDFMTHVMTQLPYALFTGAFSLLGFTAMGVFQHWLVTPVMMIVVILVLVVMKKFYRNKPIKVKYVSKNIIK